VGSISLVSLIPPIFRNYLHLGLSQIEQVFIEVVSFSLLSLIPPMFDNYLHLSFSFFWAEQTWIHKLLLQASYRNNNVILLKQSQLVFR
jgi:hypothetical protein